MKTNDIKKGARILLRNGWYGTMYDNMKGNTRMAEVEGFETEIGSVYSHDIMEVLVDGYWVRVEHTPKQLECRAMAGKW
jgi:hypothetical protein